MMSCQPVTEMYSLHRNRIFQYDQLSLLFFSCFRYLLAVLPKGSRSASKVFISIWLIPSFFSASSQPYSSPLCSSSFYCLSSLGSQASLIFLSPSSTPSSLPSSLILFLIASIAFSSFCSAILSSHASLYPLFLLNTKKPSWSISPIRYYYRMLKGSILLPKYQSCCYRLLLRAFLECRVTACSMLCVKLRYYYYYYESQPQSFCLRRLKRASSTSLPYISSNYYLSQASNSTPPQPSKTQMTLNHFNDRL